jgi:transposase
VEEPRVIADATTIMFGLPAVRDVDIDGDNRRVVHVVTDEGAAAACPAYGVFPSSVRQYRTTQPKDLPYGEAPLVVRWRKAQCRRSSNSLVGGAGVHVIPYRSFT